MDVDTVELVCNVKAVMSEVGCGWRIGESVHARTCIMLILYAYHDHSWHDCAIALHHPLYLTAC